MTYGDLKTQAIFYLSPNWLHPFAVSRLSSHHKLDSFIESLSSRTFLLIV
jgi:hypothetical protein